jgi:hypothetical protein
VWWKKMDFIEKVKGFILEPIETFQKVKDEETGEALRFFIIWLLIVSALSAIFFSIIGITILSTMPQTEELAMLDSFIGVGGGIIIAIFMFVFMVIFGVITIFIGAGIIHLGVLIVGGKNGYHQTLKSLIYGGTPSYLFGWIPFIGTIGSIWSLILAIFGIKELQEISTGKAIIAVLLPFIILSAIASFFILAVFLPGLSQFSLPLTP